MKDKKEFRSVPIATLFNVYNNTVIAFNNAYKVKDESDEHDCSFLWIGRIKYELEREIYYRIIGEEIE